MAALILLAVLSLDARLAGARADELADCSQGSGVVQIWGCTQIITSGRARGGVISKQQLATIHYNRGTAYDKMGKYDPAIADYDKAISLNPKYVNAYANLARAYRKKGKYAAALAFDAQAIKSNPKNASAYHNSRAWTYFKWGKAGKGLPDANKAIALDPEDANAYDTRGHIYEALDLMEVAIDDYRMALELRPSDEDFKKNLKRLGVTP